MNGARDSEALLRRFFDDVLNGRDRAAAAELLAPSFTDHDPMPGQAPGAEGLLAAIESMHVGLPDCRYEPLLVIPEDSKVAAHWRLTGTNTGSLFGQEPTGNAVTVAGVDVLALRDGRVEERWSKWERHLISVGSAPARHRDRQGADRIESEGKRVVRRVVEEMWNRGDPAAIEELLHEDLVEHGAFGGEAGGREDARRTVGGFRAAFPDLALEVGDMVGEGEHVVLRWAGAGTHEGPFMGAPPTGNRVEIEGIDIYRVVGGRVVEHWGYPDLVTLIEQLGGPPAR